jgi:hypothetical protein
VREPSVMHAKQQNFGSLYDREEGPERKIYAGEFDYSSIDALQKYHGEHPQVMKELIAKMNWTFEHDLSKNQVKLKDRFKNLVEKITGRRPFDHNNFKII